MLLDCSERYEIERRLIESRTVAEKGQNADACRADARLYDFQAFPRITLCGLCIIYFMWRNWQALIAAPTKLAWLLVQQQVVLWASIGGN
jgi:hypothetical protein